MPEDQYQGHPAIVSVTREQTVILPWIVSVWIRAWFAK
jgi:hypothetical protein